MKPHTVPNLLDRRGISGLVTLYGIQAMNLILPFLSVPFLFRALGTEQFGRLSMALALSLLWVLLIDAGFASTAFRLLSRLKPQSSTSHAFRRLFYATQQTRGVLVLAVILLQSVWLALFVQDSGTQWLAVIGWLNLLGTLSLPAYLFLALSKTRELAVCHLIGRGTATACIIFFVRSPGDLLLAMFISSSASLMSGLCAHGWLLAKGYISLMGYWRLRIVDWFYLRARIQHLYASQVAQAFVSQMPLILVGYFGGALVAGQYASVEKLAKMIAALIEPFTAVVIPRLAKNSVVMRRTYRRRLVQTIALAALLIFASNFFLAEYVLTLIYKNIDPIQILVFRVLTLWACIRIIVIMLEECYYFSEERVGEHRQVVKKSIPIQAACIACGSFLGPAYAAIGLVCAELMTTHWFLKSRKEPQ